MALCKAWDPALATPGMVSPMTSVVRPSVRHRTSHWDHFGTLNGLPRGLVCLSKPWLNDRSNLLGRLRFPRRILGAVSHSPRPHERFKGSLPVRVRDGSIGSVLDCIN